MSSVTKHGANGAAGANGTASSPNGQPGMPGGAANARNVTSTDTEAIPRKRRAAEAVKAGTAMALRL